MAKYYHRTTLSETGIGFPASNAADLADWNANFKNLALRVGEIEVLELTFTIEKTFTQFKAIITVWSDVKYTLRNSIYELSLITETPL